MCVNLVELRHYTDPSEMSHMSQGQSEMNLVWSPELVLNPNPKSSIQTPSHATPHVGATPSNI